MAMMMETTIHSTRPPTSLATLTLFRLYLCLAIDRIAIADVFIQYFIEM